jgi:hypothetical protein
MRPERIAEVGDLSVWRPSQRDLTGLTSRAGAYAATEAANANLAHPFLSAIQRERLMVDDEARSVWQSALREACTMCGTTSVHPLRQSRFRLVESLWATDSPDPAPRASRVVVWPLRPERRPSAKMAGVGCRRKWSETSCCAALFRPLSTTISNGHQEKKRTRLRTR